MAQPSARQIALRALRAWREEKRFADSIISQRLGEADLMRPDRAFALELFYGVLRNVTLLDFWIDRLRTSRIDIAMRDILRLGLYQLFLLGTARHAAVFETVALAPKKQRAVINGVLRAAARRREELCIKPVRSRSSFGLRIRSSSLPGGGSTSATKTRRNCATGIICRRRSMAESIN